MNQNFLKKASGISMIVFPFMLLTGFLMHPDILSLKITETVAELVRNFHHQPLFHVGHLIVFAAVPFIIIAVTGLILIETGKGSRWIIYGGIAAVTGAVILAGDKGALCIVLSAFNTLPEHEFQIIEPALRTILQRKGLLSLFILLPLLPLGAAAQLIGIIRAGKIRKIIGLTGIIGLLLLNNPDIEIISSAGAVLMCICYLPLGIKMFKGDIE